MAADDDWEDWEEWDGQSKFSHHVAAGSCAGLVEHLAIFPLDTLRTFKQTHVVDSTGVSLRTLYRQGGVKRLYRGASSVLSGCVPAHAAYFSIYELGKKYLVETPGHHPLAAAACGAAATLSHDLFMTPLDVVKQRLQLGFYKGMFDCLHKIVKYEGVRALFVSFPTTLLMNIPYGGVMVATNESLKTVLNPSGERNIPAFFLSGAGAGALAALVTNPLDVAKTRLQTQCILLSPAATGLTLPGPNTGVSASAAAALIPTPAARAAAEAAAHGANVAGPMPVAAGATGMTAAVAATANMSAPRDMAEASSASSSSRGGRRNKLKCETLKCTAQEGPAVVESCKVVRFHGLLDTLRVILKEEGLRGFTRGLQPRLMTHIPSVATTWTTYEVVKRFLVEHDS